MKGENETLLLSILNNEVCAGWEKEYMGIIGRRFRFDCAHPYHKIVVEIEGGLFIVGRHNRPVGMQKDMEKYNLCTLHGWKLLRYTPHQLHRIPGRIVSEVKLLIHKDQTKDINTSTYK